MVKKSGKRYIPDRGDIVWLDFDPQVGREQAKRRPALCLSPKEYNEKSELAIFCPITKQEKNYPFEVKLKTTKTEGVVLSDQVKSLDYTERNAEYKEKADESVVKQVQEYICMLIEEDI